MDRISLQLDVRRLDPAGVLDSGAGTDSHTLREGVLKARAFADWRRAKADEAGGERAGRKGACAGRPPGEVIASCGLADQARDFIISMAQAHSMSGRALVSTLGVARTIADLEESESVRVEHLAEAIGFRLREGVGGR